MKFDEYQERAGEYDLFEPSTDLGSVGFMEKVLGLAGEAGETVDKIKKILRDEGGVASESDIAAVEKELGDVLWYVASVARYLEIPLSRVAKNNLEKLDSRKQRNQLHGEGDER